MKRPTLQQLPRRIWLDENTWATKYSNSWTVYDRDIGVIGIAYTETELRERFG